LTQNRAYDAVKTIASDNLLAALDAHSFSLVVVDRFANAITGSTRLVICANSSSFTLASTAVPTRINSTCFATNFSGGQVSVDTQSTVPGPLEFSFAAPDYTTPSVPAAFVRTWYTDGNFVFEGGVTTSVASTRLVSVSMQRRPVNGVESIIETTATADLIMTNGSASSSTSTLSFFNGVAVFQISNNVAEVVELLARDTTGTDFSTTTPGYVTFVPGELHSPLPCHCGSPPSAFDPPRFPLFSH
jgi:hypothetical protein